MQGGVPGAVLLMSPNAMTSFLLRLKTNQTTRPNLVAGAETQTQTDRDLIMLHEILSLVSARVSISIIFYTCMHPWARSNLSCFLHFFPFSVIEHFARLHLQKLPTSSMSHVHMAIYFLQTSNKRPAGTNTFEKIFLFPQGGSTAKVMNPCIWHSHFWLTSKNTQFVAACPSPSFISYCSRSHICLE